QVLSEQVSARGSFGCGHNQSVPKRELITILKVPCPFEKTFVHRYGFPSQKIAHFGLRPLARAGPFLCDFDVELLQHLETDPAATALPQFRAPRARGISLLEVGIVERVDENVGVNEDGSGHAPPRATGIGRRSSGKVFACGRVAWQFRSYFTRAGEPSI